MVYMQTYGQLLLALVRSPRLSFQHQLTTRPQLAKHSNKCSFESGIAVHQVNPFGDAQRQNHIILLTLPRQVGIAARYVVTLQQDMFRENMQNSEHQFHYSIISISAHY